MFEVQNLKTREREREREMASGNMKGYFKQKKSGGGRGIAKPKPSKKSTKILPTHVATLGSDVVQPSTLSAHDLQGIIFFLFSPLFVFLLHTCNFIFDFLIIFNFMEFMLATVWRVRVLNGGN